MYRYLSYTSIHTRRKVILHKIPEDVLTSPELAPARCTRFAPRAICCLKMLHRICTSPGLESLFKRLRRIRWRLQDVGIGSQSRRGVASSMSSSLSTSEGHSNVRACIISRIVSEAFWLDRAGGADSGDGTSLLDGPPTSRNCPRMSSVRQGKNSEDLVSSFAIMFASYGPSNSFLALALETKSRTPRQWFAPSAAKDSKFLVGFLAT